MQAINTSHAAARILLVGPPAAGKSAVLQHFHLASGGSYEHANLDDEVLALCEERGITGPLSDDCVNEAVDRLLANAAPIRPVVVELPHHDYFDLIHREALRFEEFDHVIAVTAPLATLLERNRHRQYIVPENYIARCYGATAALIEKLRSSRLSWILLDSELMNVSVMAALADAFLRQRSSQSLGKLEVAPIPDAPYLGGNLAADVEWDSSLVNKMIQQWHPQTALDVGCGLGLTLDRFANFGVMCWGLEGNLRVLDGPCRHKERLFIVDFHKQWVQLPRKFDLVWCVEVLEHVPPRHEQNVLQTVVRNAGNIVFVSSASPGQSGYFHVNCQFREYWIERFEALGLRYLSETKAFLEPLANMGPFGENFLKTNGILLEVSQ